MKLNGAMTALVTPMRDGAIDVEALHRLVDMQIAAGIHGLVAVGTTGESATLSYEEDLTVVRETVAAARGRVPVVAGAGGNDTAAAIQHSKECIDAGADALLHVVPYYNRPSQEGLYRHFQEIANASDRPIILYNVPGRTSCDLLPETVARLAEHERIVAIKEATGSMKRASDLHRLCGDSIDLLSGDDFTTFAFYALGGRGVISVISNVMPKAMVQMWESAERGDWSKARELHFQMMPLLDLLFSESNPTPTKAALELMGVIGPEIRLPLLPATDELRSQLRAQLQKDRLL